MAICTGVRTKKVIELENHFIFRLFLNLEMSKCELKSAFFFSWTVNLNLAYMQAYKWLNGF